MQTLIFGNALLAGRTKRQCGGTWVDLETHKLEAADTLFIEAGAIIRPFRPWPLRSAVKALGATLEDPNWQEYFKGKLPQALRPRSFLLSAKAIRELNKLRRDKTFWEAFTNLEVRTWVEPQLRNWFYERLRVLQVITSLQVGGAERVCCELARMTEVLGIASWGKARRSALRAPDWDLSNFQSSERMTKLIELAYKLHVDIVHTHLLTADQNAALERHFPLMTTIHNSPAAWPKGYQKKRPGYLVACSRAVADSLGPKARVAWNGVSMQVTKRKRHRSPKKISLIAVANYRPQKRLHKLPAIVKALKDKGYNAQLTIVGEVLAKDPVSARCRAQLISNAKRVGVQSRVTEIKTLEVRKYLAMNDVFVSVSSYEGLSLAQLEALGAGLPVVTSHVAGSEELKAAVDSGAYITLPINARATSYANAIIEAHKLPRKNRLPPAFTAQAMKQRYQWIYTSALAKGPAVNEVWLLTNNFSMGGAQSSARRLLKHWSRKQNVRALTLQETLATKGSQDLIAQGIPVKNLIGRSAKERAQSLLRECAERRPRAILFWNVMSPEKCLLADALTVPIIDVSPGEMYFTEMSRYLTEPIAELPIRSGPDYGRLIHKVVVKYRREAKHMTKFLSKRAVVIPNGVSGIKRQVRKFNRELVFGTAARIAPHKRLEDLLESFNGTNAKLLIAGRIENGAESYAEKLRRMSTKNIIWMGEMEIQRFHSQIDIFVMISEPAGCPNASLEAMASGLPIMITDVGGANEQAIPGVNGWLLPQRDVQSMTKAVNEALKLPKSKLLSMAKASIKQSNKFSMDTMLNSYRMLIP